MIISWLKLDINILDDAKIKIIRYVNGIDWDGVVDLIIERVLRPPEELRTVCPECHKSAHLEEQLNKKTGDRLITENRQPEPASLV